MSVKLFAIAAAALAFAAPALAQEDWVNGTFSGGATALSASGGVSLGNGNSFSEAGQFAGTVTTFNMDGRFGQNVSNLDGMTVTGSVETFTEGFDRARSRGDALAGAVRGGIAGGSVNWTGAGADDW